MELFSRQNEVYCFPTLQPGTQSVWSWLNLVSVCPLLEWNKPQGNWRGQAGAAVRVQVSSVYAPEGG